MRYNSALNLEHFEDASFVEALSEIFPHAASSYANYPVANEVAKAWEITQAVRAFRDFNVLHEDAELLGVAAGFEHTIFYLTNYVKRVFATDLYETNGFWTEANGAMMFDPARFATPGMTWQPRRLVVQHMDALDLRYEDRSFDGIFSSGSIEHFGTPENVAAAVQEMARVLKPGGILAISTEFRIDGPADEIGIPGAIIFSPAMLAELIVNASGLKMTDEPDFCVSQRTRASAYPLQDAIDYGTRARSIALTQGDFIWTSVSLCLRKP